MALSRAQIQQAFQNSLGRAASQSEEDSYFSVSQSGALPDATIFTTISNSQEANLISDPVVRFYQAVFGRVPDAGGLDNTQDYIRANGASAATYQNLATMFAQSPEFTNRFGTGTTVDAGYVQALYTTILGRQASAAEINGYTSGSNGFTTRGQVLYAISQSQEAIGISDPAVNGFLNNAAQGTAVYTGTLYTPQNGAPGGALSGETFALTTGIDNIVGTVGNDAVIGTVAAAGSTLNPGDQINGGDGTSDKFTIFSDGTALSAGITVSSVEQIYIQNNAAAVATTVTAAAGTFTGATQLWAQSSTGGVTYTGVNAATQTAGISGSFSNGVDVTFTYSDVGGTNDSASLVLNNAKLGNATGNPGVVALAGIETLNVSGNGTGITINDTALKTLNIAATGASSFTTSTVDGANVASITAPTTIDASKSTAGVTVTAANTADLKFTGGAGDDSLRLGLTLNAADTIDGGAGTDTVRINGGDYSLASNGTLQGINKLVSIEALQFQNAGGAVATVLDGDTLTTSAKVIFRTNDADTVNNAGSRTYAFGEGNTSDATFNAKVGQTTLNLEVISDDDNATVAGIVQANGQNIVNIAVTGEDGGLTNSFAQLNVAANTTVNITGEPNFLIGGVKAVGGTDFAVGATGAVLNGSAATGKLTLVGSGGADVITGGSGNDVISGGTSADVITFGGGNDEAHYTTANATGFTNGDRIVDFTSGAGADSGDFIAFLDNGVAGGVGAINFANSADTVAGSQGSRLNAADYVESRAGVTNILVADTLKVIELQSAQTTAQLQNDVGGAANGYLVAFNSTTGKGEIYYDADWSNNTDRSLVATLDNVTSLSQVQALTSKDFGVYNSLTTINLADGGATSDNSASPSAVTVNGGNGNDTITGSAGNDTLNGNAGNDTISGGAGNDTINGGTGQDTLTGGTGTNTFVFALGDSGTPTATNFDTITDFNAGTNNKIDFGALPVTVQATVAPAASGTAAISATGLATFDAADNTLALKIAAVQNAINAGTNIAGESAIFVDSGNSYIFTSDGVAGVGANDVLIKATGIVATGITIAGGDITAITV